MILPLFLGAFGCILFGIGGQCVYKVQWMCLMSGSTVLTTAFIFINIVASVVVRELSSTRWVSSFAISSDTQLPNPMQAGSCQRRKSAQCYRIWLHLRHADMGHRTRVHGCVRNIYWRYRIRLFAASILLHLWKATQEEHSLYL